MHPNSMSFKLLILLLIIISTSEKFFKYEEEDITAILRITHTKSLNLLTEQNHFFDELEIILDLINFDKIKSLIITTNSNEKFVKPEYDLSEIKNINKQQAQELFLKGNIVLKKLETLPVPVISVIDGFSLGLVLELALCSDIRICSEKSIFGLPETGLGLIPNFGSIQRLTKIIGENKAKYIIYTANQIYAQEALRIGLVNGIYSQTELLDKAKNIAETINKNSPKDVRLSKKAINEGMETDIDTGIKIEEKYFWECFENYQQREYMLKFMNKKRKINKQKEEEEKKTRIPKEVLEDKNKNFIVATFDITESGNMLLINSYERFYEKNNHKYNYVEYNKELENREDIDKTEIYINGERMFPFNYAYRFEQPGKYKIIYKFNKPLTSAAYLFYDVNNMVSIDLTNFDTRYLNITSSMFEYCDKLESINFTNFNVNNLVYTDSMFHGCGRLKEIELPKLNMSKIKNRCDMFKGCYAKVSKNN